jgi:type II secretory pathway pseudopilin PulG
MRLIHRHRRLRSGREAFTLAEVAVTLVIVGMTLLLVLEGLNSSRTTAAQSANRRLSLELGLMTMARVEAGLLWEDLDGIGGTLSGSYAEEDYEAFFWEITVGEDDNADFEQDQDSPYFDNFAHRQYVETESSDSDPEDRDPFSDSGSTGGSYEKVVVRVTYPQLMRSKPTNVLVLERWIPLDLVFGKSDEQLDAEEDARSDDS